MKTNYFWQTFGAISQIKFNPNNEKIKEEYFLCLENAKGRDKKTVKAYATSIHEFELFTDFQDFKQFKKEQAVGFKEYLLNKKNLRTGDQVSYSYLRCATSVQRFFEWLERQKSYRKFIDIKDVEYFSLTRNDARRANATKFQESHEIYDIISTIRRMPGATPHQMRNKAMISLCLLTTPRISALQTARLCSIKHFKDRDVYAFVQNPNIVNTKFAHNITAYFIGNVQDIYDNVLNWITFLRNKGFDDKDYLFPRFEPTFTKEYEILSILEKKMIKSQTTIRDIFAKAFEANGLPYLKPHTFRHSITRKANELPDASKWISALSQNFGHLVDSVIISSYGTIPEAKRGVLLKSFKIE